MKTKTSAIYGIFGPNDRIYVGSAVSTDLRFKSHRNHLNAGKHHCSHLQRAWNKYGTAAFEFRILEECSGYHPKALLPVEQKWMDAHRDQLYNSAPTAGSLAGYKFSDAVKAAAALRMRGFRHSDETKQRLSENAMGRPAYNKGIAMPTSQRLKLSEAALGRPPVSPEQRVKHSDAIRRRMAAGWTRATMTIRKPEMADKVVAAYESDITISAASVAKLVGVTRHTAEKYLKRAGIDLSVRRIHRSEVSTEERSALSLLKAKFGCQEVAVIRALKEDGKSYAEIAERFSVSLPTIMRVVLRRTPYDKV